MLRASTISCRWPGPQSPSLLVIHPPPRGVGWCYLPQHWTQEHKGACKNGGLPDATDIPREMAPFHVNVSNTQQIYYCQAEGCHKESLTSHSAICTHVYHDHLGTKLSCPLCSTTFLMLLPQSGMGNRHTTPCLYVPIDVGIVLLSWLILAPL